MVAIASPCSLALQRLLRGEPRPRVSHNQEQRSLDQPGMVSLSQDGVPSPLVGLTLRAEVTFETQRLQPDTSLLLLAARLRFLMREVPVQTCAFAMRGQTPFDEVDHS